MTRPATWLTSGATGRVANPTDCSTVTALTTPHTVSTAHRGAARRLGWFKTPIQAEPLPITALSARVGACVPVSAQGSPGVVRSCPWVPIAG